MTLGISLGGQDGVWSHVRTKTAIDKEEEKTKKELIEIQTRLSPCDRPALFQNCSYFKSDKEAD